MVLTRADPENRAWPELVTLSDRAWCPCSLSGHFKLLIRVGEVENRDEGSKKQLLLMLACSVNDELCGVIWLFINQRDEIQPTGCLFLSTHTPKIWLRSLKKRRWSSRSILVLYRHAILYFHSWRHFLRYWLGAMPDDGVISWRWWSPNAVILILYYRNERTIGIVAS